MSRSVLVTGGNRGIGLAIARAMAKDGDQVTVTHRTGEPPVGLAGVVCEVTDTDSVDAAFTAVEKNQGPVQVLVANAGITRDQLVSRMSDEEYESVLATNLAGTFRVVRRASRSMMRRRYGRIVMVGSVVGAYGSPGQVNYGATKAGLVGMARSLARELGPRGITANVVAPGFIETDMTRDLPPDRREALLGAIPIARFGAADEVAEVVRFLAAETSGYVTGAVVPVDGGIAMGL